MEPAVAEAEGVVGEDAVPGLADEGGTEEVRRLVRGNAEEDPLDKLNRQRGRLG